MRPRAIEVFQLEGVAVEIVELVELPLASAVDPVDVLVAVGAHRLVGHPHQPGQGIFRPVLDEQRFSPAAAPPREEGEQRAALNLRARLASGELDERRCDILADHEVADAPACLHLARVAHQKR